MSKEKMDAYKEAKKNRKANIEKEKKAQKFDKVFWRVVLGVVAAGLIALLTISLINVFRDTTDYSGYTETEYILLDENNIQGTAESEDEETSEASGDDTTEGTEGTEAENKTE